VTGSQAALAAVLLLAAAPSAAQDGVRKDGDTLEFLDDPTAKPYGAAAAAPAADLPFGADTVRATAEAHQAEVTGCYETTLARGQHPQGEVRVRFTVGKNGLVSHAAVQRSTLRQPRVEACIVQAVRSWRFPKPARPKTIVFPFRLSVDRAAGGEQVLDPPRDEPPAAPADAAAPTPSDPRR
jgi:TonB family protein